MVDKKKDEEVEEVKTEKNQMIEVPAGTKFILVFESPNKPLGLKTGGFMNVDEMLGFNRRCVNPELVERMIITGVQQEMQKQQQQQQ